MNQELVMTFLALVFAHLLGDYPLQGQFLAEQKGNNPILLVTHAVIWTGTIALAGHLLGFNVDLVDVTVLFTVHVIADGLKATGKLGYAKMDALKGGLLVDQGIHIVQILVFILMNA